MQVMARVGRATWFTLFLVLGIRTLSMESQATPQQQAAPPAGPAASPAPQSAPRPAQQQPASASATVLKVTTRLVVVDVVATKDGRAVTDLERGDFTVLEDGKEQEIRGFGLQKPSLTASPKSAVVVRKLPEGVATNVPQFNFNNTLNVVLLDALNTTAPNQAYVRQEMINYLRKMPEGQPVAVYLLTSKLTLLQDFTTDPEVLQAVVKKIKGRISPVLDSPTGGPDAEILPAGAVDSGLVSGDMLQSIMSFEQERVAFQTDIRVTYTMSALKAISRSLAAYSGRKNLIWISEAFPLSIDPNLELTLNSFAGTRTYSEQIAGAADALTDAQIAIYPIDARGLVTSSLFDASNSGRDKFGRARTGPRMGAAIQQESAALQAVHATMQDMAERTGGQAFYNRNDIDAAIRRSIEDGSTYYTLAYYPANKDWNGKFRKIHIKTARAGVKLRHRLGYYAVDPRAYAEMNHKQQGEAFTEALSLDSPVSTALLFEAAVVPPSEKTQNKVQVNFGIDPHALNFESRADGLQHATVACAVEAFAKGKSIKIWSSTVNASLKPETYTRVMQSTFPCHQSIDLPAGTYTLRLGVRDENTGLLGTANASVTVAQTTPPAPDAKPSEDKKQ
jgi:VWFA-related protein